MNTNSSNRHAFLAAAVVSAMSAVASAQVHPEKPTYPYEKCYGVAKAGKNDCFTAKNSCAGTTTQDSGAAGVDLRAEGHVQPNRRRHHHRTERLTTEPFFTDVFINQGDSR